MPRITVASFFHSRRGRVCIASFLGTAAAVLFLLATIRQPLRTNWGDPWSDANVQSSGKNFVHDGFVKLAFTPTVDIQPTGPDSLRYSHYPPLPDLVNGFQQWVFGPQDISFYRVLALSLSFAALLFFFRYVREVWGETTALFALPLFAFNALFLQYADTIHHVPIYWCAGWGALYGASRWLSVGDRRSLFGAGFGVFVCFMASYDYLFFVPLMALTTVYKLGNTWRQRRGFLLLLTVFVGGTIAVVLKTVLVIWAIGLHEFWKDFVFQFHERATTKHSADYKDGFVPILLGRFWRFFGPFIFVALVANVVSMVERFRRRPNPLTASSPLLVLVAGAAFVAIFSQLFCEQYHPTLEFLPYFAIGVGSVLAAIWSNTTWRWAEVTALATLVAVFGWQTREVVRFKKTFLERDDAALVRSTLDASDTRNLVLTNAIVDAPFRFFWDRYPMGVNGAAVFLNLRDLFARYGTDRPFMYLQFDDVEDTAFDKVLWGLFAAEHRWGWIADPYRDDTEWRERLRKDDAQQRSQLEPFAQVVARGRHVNVLRIDYEAMDRHQRASLPQGDTRHINFETNFANRYKGWGWGWAEQYGFDPGFAWMNEHQRKRLIFTLKGLKDLPEGEMVRTSTLLLRLSPETGWRIKARGFSQVPGNVLSMRANGSPKLGEMVADSPNGPRDYVFDIPKEYLKPDGVQELEYSFTKATEDWHHGVAFLWLDADPI